MLILGLHFGHDAAAAVLRDGRVAAYVLRERQNRVKHAMTLDMATIETALDEAGVTAAQLDHVAITSTQRKDLIIDSPERLRVRFARHPGHTAPETVTGYFRDRGLDIADLLSYDLTKYLYESDREANVGAQVYALFYPEHADRPAEARTSVGWLDRYVSVAAWERERSLAEIAVAGFAERIDDAFTRFGFHYPVVVELDGCEIPGYFVHHHLCHAAATFYGSGYREAAILTHDGHSRPRDYNTGMFYYGIGEKIFPLTPHHLFLGALYDHVGFALGLGLVGAAGKLMGLAAWGEPGMLDRRFVGNLADFCGAVRPDGDYRAAWMEHCLTLAEAQGHELSALADPARMTEPVNADIAASTQLLFEETLLAAGRTLATGLERAGVHTRNLCLSGGTALNCPANSRLWRESEFDNVFVEPGCDDSGVAIGAAQAIYHNAFGHGVADQGEPRRYNAYLGCRSRPAGVAAVDHARARVAVVDAADPVAHAAEMLAEGAVLGWYEGRSEIGPRALGHRSILCDPRQPENGHRVNVIKGRESWRPLAPAVLEEEAGKWFDGCPLPSPHMLFTAAVTSPEVPAITHVDGSARVQTVGPECGAIRRLLELFFALTGVPILMNTSFNDRGEPIVESPRDAFRGFLGLSLDALYLDGTLYRNTAWRGVDADSGCAESPAAIHQP